MEKTSNLGFKNSRGMIRMKPASRPASRAQRRGPIMSMWFGPTIGRITDFCMRQQPKLGRKSQLFLQISKYVLLSWWICSRILNKCGETMESV